MFGNIGIMEGEKLGKIAKNISEYLVKIKWGLSGSGLNMIGS